MDMIDIVLAPRPGAAPAAGDQHTARQPLDQIAAPSPPGPHSATPTVEGKADAI